MGFGCLGVGRLGVVEMVVEVGDLVGEEVLEVGVFLVGVDDVWCGSVWVWRVCERWWWL